MDAAFQLAARQRTHFCLGLKLHELCLGHLFLLRELDSAFLTGERVTLPHLVTSVFICAHPYPSAAKRLRSLLWSYLFVPLWGFKTRKMDLSQEAQTFRAYLQEERVAPKIRAEVNNDRRDFGSPFEWRLLSMLMSEFHLSYTQALAFPVAKSNCLWATLGETRDSFKLWNGAIALSGMRPKKRMTPNSAHETNHPPRHSTPDTSPTQC